MKILTESNFQSEMANKFLLVTFGADWCTPCSQMKDNLSKLESKIRISDKVQFAYVDIDNTPVLEDKYNIDSYPTIVLFKNGKELGRSEGRKTSDQVLKFISSCLNS